MTLPVPRNKEQFLMKLSYWNSSRYSYRRRVFEGIQRMISGLFIISFAGSCCVVWALFACTAARFFSHLHSDHRSTCAVRRESFEWTRTGLRAMMEMVESMSRAMTIRRARAHDCERGARANLGAAAAPPQPPTAAAAAAAAARGVAAP